MASSQSEGPEIQKGCIWGPAKSANDLLGSRETELAAETPAAESFTDGWGHIPLQRHAAGRAAGRRRDAEESVPPASLRQSSLMWGSRFQFLETAGM